MLFLHYNSTDFEKGFYVLNLTLQLKIMLFTSVNLVILSITKKKKISYEDHNRRKLIFCISGHRNISYKTFKASAFRVRLSENSQHDGPARATLAGLLKCSSVPAIPT